MCSSNGNGGFNFNPLGVIMNADGKFRKPKDMLNYALNPGKLGGIFEAPTKKDSAAPAAAATAAGAAAGAAVSNIQNNDPLKKTAKERATTLLASNEEDTAGPKLY